MHRSHQPDPVLLRQRTEIEKIIRHETWLESERRGGAFGPRALAVLENVSRVIFQVGGEMRAKYQTDG